MRLKRRCDGRCRGCGQCYDNAPKVRSRNEMPESDPDDISYLRDYLSERYTARSFVQEICEKPRVVEKHGLLGATENTLAKICDRQCLCICDEDIHSIAVALVERGDITYRGA